MNIQDIKLLSPQEVKQEMERTRASERNYSQFRHRLRDGSVRNVAVAGSAGATVHRPCNVSGHSYPASSLSADTFARAEKSRSECRTTRLWWIAQAAIRQSTEERTVNPCRRAARNSCAASK